MSAAGPMDVVADLIDQVEQRLAEGKRVRRTLPAGGRLHIDRPLPFLCVYRRPPRRADEGTRRLVTTEAAYLIAPGGKKHREFVTTLVRRMTRAMTEHYGAFLILEVWSIDAPEDDHGSIAAPAFRIVVGEGAGRQKLVRRLRDELAKVRLQDRAAEVESRESRKPGPRGQPAILPDELADELNCTLVGLGVRAVYRDGETGKVYPLQLRELRRAMSRALRPVFYEFVRKETTYRPGHYHVLGRRALVRAVREVDRELAAVSDLFDFLLQVTPVNSAAAWNRFRETDFERAPELRYRPLRIDPLILKRRLHQTQLESVEDPALARIFTQKLVELDRQLTMLIDLDTPSFLHGSLQLYGGVDDDLLRLVRELLETLPPRTRGERSDDALDATAFAEAARAELEDYRRQWPEMDGRVEIRDDIASGLMVSRGSLLVGRDTRIPASRADALLQHEVGTHVLTYHNGRAQPFRQLYSGLAGYEALQEGLAVLAEYLVGGLSPARLRLLAGRVVAARALIDGATFVDTFRLLNREHGFAQRVAFIATLRTHRGGGLTKDALYLDGLREVLCYLGDGGELGPLFVGKIAAEHVPTVDELRWRGILREPPLKPRYMKRPDVRERLARVRSGIDVLDMLERRPR